MLRERRCSTNILQKEGFLANLAAPNTAFGPEPTQPNGIPPQADSLHLYTQCQDQGLPWGGNCGKKES